MAPTERWTPAVEAVLAEALAAAAPPSGARGAAPPVAVFDFDNTLILGDVALVALAYQVMDGRFGFHPADDGGFFAPATARRFARREAAAGAERERLTEALVYDLYARYLTDWDGGRKLAASAYLVGLLHGFTVEEARQLGRDTMARAAREPLGWRVRHSADRGARVRQQWGIRVQPALRSLVERLRAGGFDVWIATASPQRLVEGAAEAFGVPPGRVVGVRSEEAHGRITTASLAPVTIGAGKRAALEQRLGGRRPALAVGDTWTDYELLLWAERAILLDTGRDAPLAAALGARGVVVQPALGPYGSTADLPVIGDGHGHEDASG